MLLWYAAGLRSRGRGKEKETGYKVRTEMVGPTRGRTVISQGKSRRAGEEGTAEENEREGRMEEEAGKKNLVRRDREGGYEVGGGLLFISCGGQENPWITP